MPGRPVQRLRTFNWNKVNQTSAQGTVWEAIKDDAVSLNLDEIASLFAVQPAKQPKKAAPKPNERKHLNLIDTKRCTNVGIQMHRLGLSAAEVKRAITRMDHTVLSGDTLEILLKCLPTTEEYELIYNHVTDNPEDQERLSDVERFFLELGAIPHANVRVQGLTALAKGSGDLDYICEKVRVMKRAMQEVRESGDLKRVLRVVLAIGNALNAGSNRGEASGFRIDDLTRLKDTKTVDNSMTLLHFVAQKLVELEDHCELDLRVSLPSLGPACEVSVDELKRLLTDFNASLKICTESLSIVAKKTEPVRRTTAKQRAMDQHISSGLNRDSRPALKPETDAIALYTTVMSSFIDKHAAQAVDVAVLLDQVTRDFETFAKSLGEDPRMKPEQLFGMLRTFSGDLLEAHHANQQRLNQADAKRGARVKRQAQHFNRLERDERERKNSQSRGTTELVPKLRLGKPQETEGKPSASPRLAKPIGTKVTKPQTARYAFVKRTATLEDLNKAVLHSVQTHDLSTMDTAELIIAMTPRLAAS